jgi:hypothetical protein
LLEELIERRKTIAAAQNEPETAIVTTQTLQEIVREKPTNLHDLTYVEGMMELTRRVNPERQTIRMKAFDQKVHPTTQILEVKLNDAGTKARSRRPGGSTVYPTNSAGLSLFSESGLPSVFEAGEVYRARHLFELLMKRRHFGIGKAMYLRMFHDKLGLKMFHLPWMPHTLSINQKKESVSNSKLLRTAVTEQKVGPFNQLLQGMSLGSSSIIPVIRSGRRRMMGFLNASSITFARKRAWFRSVGRLTELAIFLMSPKGRHTTGRSSLMPLCPI